MKIIVCIKQVPDTTEIKLDPVKGTLIRTGVPSIMNPDDKGALEQALQFKDRFGAEVHVITMGPPQAKAIIYEAFAMGCDKGYLVTDRKFGGADTLATSYTISQAIKSLGHYDVILAGRQAIDGDTAQVGPQMAEQLDLPQITYVEHVEYDGEKKLTVTKNVEDGHEVLEVELPCMLTFLAAAYEPRYMNVADIMTAFDKEIVELNFGSFPVDESRLGLKGSPTNVSKSFTKGAKAMGTLYEDMTPEDAADLILEKLQEKFII